MNAVKKIHQETNGGSVLVSEFRGNVFYNGVPVVFRFNVSETLITVAAYVGASSEAKIVGLKGTRRDSPNLGGYCERLDVVLKNLCKENSNEKVEINCETWNSLLNKSRLVAQKVGLPLVGIDMLIESNEGKINEVVLEVNARPGTLIFGEELIFNESGSLLTHSVMSSPVNDNFWNLITQLSNKRRRVFSKPNTLLEWKSYISTEYVLNWDPLNHENDELMTWFVKRYGLNDPALISDRIQCLKKTIDDCIMKNTFDMNKKVFIVFCNGRDRYFGGHTDLLGLGGPTINATTENEILMLIQESNDSSIYVSNSNKEFKSSIFSIDEILSSVNELNKNLSGTRQWGKELWSPNEWTSYLKGALAFMLSENFSGQVKVKNSLFKNNSWSGCRIHFNSSGRLELLSKVGSSSSAALTSAFVLGLNKLFEIELNTEELSRTDLGEFYLGKTAGCADKATILNAKNGKLILIASIPDRFIQSLTMPSQIVVIMANSNIPRLNSLNGK